MLNHSDSPFAHSIFPYLHSYSNHKTVEHHLLKRVLIPDVLPSEVLEGKGGEFSLVAGDFEEIYGSDDLTEDGSEGQKGKWASVVTCFFIDCVSGYTSTLSSSLQSRCVVLTLGTECRQIPAYHL